MVSFGFGDSPSRAHCHEKEGDSPDVATGDVQGAVGSGMINLQISGILMLHRSKHCGIVTL